MSLVRRILNLFRRSRMDSENDAEINFHLAMRTEDSIASGMPPDQARRDALLRFGNPSATKERVKAEDAALTLESLFADVRYVLRRHIHNRGFAVVAILTLGLGIGATTGIFSILNSWITQPLPLKDPQRPVIFWRAAAASPKEPAHYFSWRDYIYFRERSHAFQSLGASFERGYTRTGRGSNPVTAYLLQQFQLLTFRDRYSLPSCGPAGN